MNKLNERLALIANLSVVAGIVFLGLELQQNTEAVEAQTRDSITEKQMMFIEWLATNRDLAEVVTTAETAPGELDPVDQRVWAWFVEGLLREYENSHYQFERGLFTGEEYDARVNAWRFGLEFPAFRAVWTEVRQMYAPSFRAEIDRIVAEVGN